MSKKDPDYDSDDSNKTIVDDDYYGPEETSGILTGYSTPPGKIRSSLSSTELKTYEGKNMFYKQKIQITL